MNKNEQCGYYEYLISNDTELFTAFLLPNDKEKFPVVVIRNPYVDDFENMEENQMVNYYLYEYSSWLKSGYAIVVQHCRGRGKSGGDCIPYIYEREDGLLLLNTIKKQNFITEKYF